MEGQLYLIHGFSRSISDVNSAENDAISGLRHVAKSNLTWHLHLTLIVYLITHHRGLRLKPFEMVR